MLKILMQIMSKSVAIATSKSYFTVFYMRDFKKRKVTGALYQQTCNSTCLIL